MPPFDHPFGIPWTAQPSGAWATTRPLFGSGGSEFARHEPFGRFLTDSSHVSRASAERPPLSDPANVDDRSRP